MSTLIIIPAKKDSIRLKKKQKKVLGKPLIAHTIEFAKKLKFLKKIIISTDDPQIMKIGINYNV